jgi:ribosomal-protein-alanine N-acetyltransferase
MSLHIRIALLCAKLFILLEEKQKMIALKTKRLEIKNFVIDNWRDLQEIFIDFESSEYAIYDYQLPTTNNEVKEIADRFANNKFFSVCELNNNKVIGYVCFNGENDKELDLGYSFNSLYHGKGFATEACIAVINYAFDTLQVERLTAGTAKLNYPSCRVLDRLGFSLTSESIISYRKNTEGNPIEFVGSLYLLEKDEWMKKEYYHIK